MTRRIPPLNSLRAFDAASRHLSFTKAAEELHVTQAAISHQIKGLEEFLGTQLFVRRNRALLLTEEGQNYWPQIRDVFEKLAEATERLMARGAQGALTVSVVPTFAVQWLVPRLADFSKQHPDIDVRIKASDTGVDFMRSDVDVAIYYGKGDYPDLNSARLFNEHLAPVCAPSLLETLKSPADLKKHTLLHDASTEDWQRWLKLAGVEGVKMNGPIFSHSAMVQQAAIHGQGVALGHHILSRTDLAAGRLVRPFALALPSEYGYDVTCPEQWADRPKIVAFRDWLLSMVKQETDEAQA